MPVLRCLENAVNLEKFRELNAELLPEVWTAHFSAKPGNLGVSMPASLSHAIKSRISNYPMFILPISRLIGEEIVLLETVLDDNFMVQVTSLDEYKKLGPQAPIRASFTFFTELSVEKGVTLIHGRFDATQMNPIQSGTLLQNFCAAYSDDRLFQWVKDFTDRPNEFDFKEFLKAFTAPK